MNKKIKNKNMNNYVLNGDDICLTESDFYPPSDNRTLNTYIEELYVGDFNEYAGYIFDIYEYEGYYEN